MSDEFEAKDNPRVIVIQKLYGNHLNKDQANARGKKGAEAAHAVKSVLAQ